MSLTRKFLQALGIESDKVDEIITAHRDTVDALKDERDRYKADAEQLSVVQGERDGYKEKAERYEAEGWESKYNDMKAAKEKAEKEFGDFRQAAQAKETQANKRGAYRALLKDVGVTDKRLDAILKVTDLDGIELDEKGALKDADKLKETAKAEWGDFIATPKEQGAQTPTPPANDGGSGLTKEQILAVKDRNERQRLISENHELFGY